MKKEINWKLWASQFFFGYPIGDESHLKDANKSKTKRTDPIPRFILPKPDKSISDFKTAVKNSACLLQESIETELKRNIDCKPIVFLSGGWDSRAILCALKKVSPNKKIKAYTTSYDAGNNQEEVFAAKVAKTLNVPHQIVPLTDTYYIDNCFHSIEQCNYQTKMHVWMSAFVEQLNLPPCSINFDGYAGDILFRGMRQSINDPNLSPYDPSFFDRFAVLKPKSILSGPVYKTLENLARESLSEELAKYEPETRVLNFLLNNRGARGVAHSIAIQRQHFKVCLPFMSNLLLQNTVNIDPQIRLDDNFYPSILKELNSEVAILPSSNTKNLPDNIFQEIPQKKYEKKSLDWMYTNIITTGEEYRSAGGLIDWYTLTNERKINQQRSGLELKRHNRVLEMLHLYSVWYKKNVGPNSPPQNLLLDTFKRSNPILPRTGENIEEDLDSIFEEYLTKFNGIENSQHTVLVNLTVDVEGYGIDDYYSSHTAEKDTVNTLMLGKFEWQSDLERIFIDTNTPCTFFVECFGKEWRDDTQLEDVLSKLSRSFTEIGLHCHTFSLSEEIKEELNLSDNWILDCNQLSSVYSWGKKRLMDRPSVNYEVTSFRSGRLDVYPNMDFALRENGFLVNSTLVDGVDDYYYVPKEPDFGNGIFFENNMIQLPITSYRSRDRIKSLDFNNATFREICEILFLAIHQNLPCVTMLMHSWSFSKTVKHDLLGKVFHTHSDEYLHRKIMRVIDLVNQTPGLEFSTVRQSSEKLKPGRPKQHPAENLNSNPALLKVILERSGSSISATALVNKMKIVGDIEYAFYLLLRGEKLATIPYSRESTGIFYLEDHSEVGALSIRAYARVVGHKKYAAALSVEIS